MTKKLLGKHIASGRTAEIYSWGNRFVIKLFNEWMSSSAVEYEARIARTVFDSGFRVPSVGNIIKIDNHYGLVYELINGETMMKFLTGKPWRFYKYARMLAELHAQMHSYSVPELPSQRVRIKNKILNTNILADKLKEQVLSLLNNIPDTNCLCHGDFHPGNILMTAQGPIIIDWMDATNGNPLADVARSSLLLQTAELPPDMPARKLFNTIRIWIHKIYLHRYFQLRPESREEFKIWVIINAAARLEENIIEEQDKLLLIVKSQFER